MGSKTLELTVSLSLSLSFSLSLLTNRNVFEINEAIKFPIFLHICKTASRRINYH